MGRVDLDPLPRRSIDPAAENSPTGKYKGVDTVSRDHCQLKIAVKWGIGCVLPIHAASWPPVVFRILIQINSA
jgi:hypothetical protein